MQLAISKWDSVSKLSEMSLRILEEAARKKRGGEGDTMK